MTIIAIMAVASLAYALLIWDSSRKNKLTAEFLATKMPTAEPLQKTDYWKYVGLTTAISAAICIYALIIYAFYGWFPVTEQESSFFIANILGNGVVVFFMNTVAGSKALDAQMIGIYERQLFNHQ